MGATSIVEIDTAIDQDAQALFEKSQLINKVGVANLMSPVPKNLSIMDTHGVHNLEKSLNIEGESGITGKSWKLPWKNLIFMHMSLKVLAVTLNLVHSV